MKLLQLLTLMLALCVSLAAGASTMTILSQERLVRATIQDRVGDGVPPAPLVVTERTSSSGSFDQGIVVATAAGQPISAVTTASQRSIINSESITAWMDTTWEANSSSVRGEAISSLDITFRLDVAVRFELLGSFDSDDFETGGANFDLVNLDGVSFRYEGSTTEWFGEATTIDASSSIFGLHNSRWSDWNISGVLPEGTYRLQAQSFAAWAFSDPSAMELDFTVDAIPEPGSALVFGLGLVAFAEKLRGSPRRLV